MPKKKEKTEVIKEPVVLGSVAKRIELVPQGAAPAFDFNSQLFKAYLKTSLVESSKNFGLGEVIAVSVFGETQQFKVLDIELENGDEKIATVTKETEIVI